MRVPLGKKFRCSPPIDCTLSRRCRDAFRTVGNNVFERKGRENVRVFLTLAAGGLCRSFPKIPLLTPFLSFRSSLHLLKSKVTHRVALLLSLYQHQLDHRSLFLLSFGIHRLHPSLDSNKQLRLQVTSKGMSVYTSMNGKQCKSHYSLSLS